MDSPSAPFRRTEESVERSVLALAARETVHEAQRQEDHRVALGLLNELRRQGHRRLAVAGRVEEQKQR
jgi:hypothetical protein